MAHYLTLMNVPHPIKPLLIHRARKGGNSVGASVYGSFRDLPNVSFETPPPIGSERSHRKPIFPQRSMTTPRSWQAHHVSTLPYHPTIPPLLERRMERLAASRALTLLHTYPNPSRDTS